MDKLALRYFHEGCLHWFSGTFYGETCHKINNISHDIIKIIILNDELCTCVSNYTVQKLFLKYFQTNKLPYTK